MKKIIYKLFYPLALLYWKIFKPKTFGVKGVITRKNKLEILLVKVSYGKKFWNLPGGGYNPNKENSIKAIQREIKEELNIKINNWKQVGSYRTRSEGKRDSVKDMYEPTPSDDEW